MRTHLQPLHIKVAIKWKKVNRILVNKGATINLLPLKILDKLAKAREELRTTNIVVIVYRGKSTLAKGVVLINVKVGIVERPTPFVVIPSKSSYNLLLGWDWIYGVGVIPSIVHQELILWNAKGEPEVIEADDHPSYLQQMHVDFKMYEPKVFPLEVNNDTFDPLDIESC